MRRIVICSFFVLGLSCLVMAGAKAEEENTSKTQVSDQTEIQLMQDAEREVEQNRLRMTLSVREQGRDARQVQSTLNKRMAVALEKAKSKHELTVETGRYFVSRQYDPKNKDTDQWQGEQSLVITSDDFAALLDMAGTLQDDNLIVDNMQFFLAPETSKAAEDELTAQALQNLQQRAAHIAKDLNMKIVRFKNISVGNVSGNDRMIVQPMMMSMRAGAAKATPPNAAAGKTTMSLQVSATVVMAK